MKLFLKEKSNTCFQSNAFTLAEVLITLGIIGVVASITIPILQKNIQDAEYKTSYKKVFSTASQVINSLCNNYEFHPVSEGVYNFNLFKSKFKISKDCSNNNNSECWAADGEMACTGACTGGGPAGQPTETNVAFIDNSGTAWSLFSVDSSNILVDTNGNKLPNKYGKDRWFLQGNSAVTTGKLVPRPDYTNSTPDPTACHYPPCYSTSWIYK